MKISILPFSEKQPLNEIISSLKEGGGKGYLQYYVGWAEISFLKNNGEVITSFKHTMLDVLANIAVGFSSIEKGRATQGAIVTLDHWEELIVWFEKKAGAYIFNFQSNMTKIILSPEELKCFLLSLFDIVFSTLKQNIPGLEETEAFKFWSDTIMEDMKAL